MSQGAVYLDVKTPDDRHFIIQNEENNIHKWHLNGKRAVESENDYDTCYKNSQIDICLDQENE
jgi:hypothetical protein